MSKQPENEQPKTEFIRIAVKTNAKREIDLIAASEQRNVYEIVDEMLQIYKAVKIGKLPRPENAKSVTVIDLIAVQ